MNNILYTYDLLVSENFRVDHVGRPGIFLVFGKEDFDISTARRLGERYMELSVRENRDSKVDPNTSDRLTLGFVDGDRKGQTHRELATL